jgi:hypothetical protein
MIKGYYMYYGNSIMKVTKNSLKSGGVGLRKVTQG